MVQKLDAAHKKQVKKEVARELKSAEKKIEKDVEKNVEKRLEIKFHKQLVSQFKKQGGHLHRRSLHVASKFRDHAATAIIAALSFLIALSWKDFISKIIKENIAISSLEKYSYLAELYAAVIITFIAIIVIMIVSRWVKKEEK